MADRAQKLIAAAAVIALAAAGYLVIVTDNENDVKYGMSITYLQRIGLTDSQIDGLRENMRGN